MLGPRGYDVWSQLLGPARPRVECELSNFGQKYGNPARIPDWHG
jgi:hypothetical protein